MSLLRVQLAIYSHAQFIKKRWNEIKILKRSQKHYETKFQWYAQLIPIVESICLWLQTGRACRLHSNNPQARTKGTPEINPLDLAPPPDGRWQDGIKEKKYFHTNGTGAKSICSKQVSPLKPTWMAAFTRNRTLLPLRKTLPSGVRIFFDVN